MMTAKPQRMTSQARVQAIVGEKRTWGPEALRAFAEGRASLAQLEGLDRRGLEVIARLGRQMLSSGKLDQAAHIFRGLVAIEPREPWFHLASGCVAFRRGDWAAADRWTSEALRLSPRCAVSAAYRGEARLQLGRVAEALADLQNALRNDVTLQHRSTHRARALLTELLKLARTATAQKSVPAARPAMRAPVKVGAA